MPTLTDDLIAGCKLLQLPVRGDERGSLVPIEAGRDVPFEIKRVYTVFGTQLGVSRGFHAHLATEQVAIAVAGGCTMILDDGRGRRSVRLDRPDQALTIPPMVWHEMEDFSADCVLMVLADAPYDEADYIRDHARFLELLGTR
jgi:dTDP-4-dehydrorhamnose 3,5-epimerase-like enzyme